MGSLKQLREADEIRILIPDITDREVRSHIRAESIATAATLKKVKKEAMLLRNLPDVPAHGIFTDISAEEIEEKLLQNWELFITGDGIEQFSVDGIAPSRVFECYFSVTPPFATGAKEKEFADAFVLERLADFSVERTHSIHVISNDTDMEKYCAGNSNLVFSKSIDEFISAVNLSVSVEPSAFAAEALNKVADEILDYVRRYLPEADYEIRSVDWDAEIDNIDIQDLKLSNSNLISVDDEQCEYELECTATIETTESVKDYDRSPFDHEDNSYPFVLESEVIRKFELPISIEARLFYEDKLLNSVSFDADLPYGILLKNPIEETRRELDINGD